MSKKSKQKTLENTKGLPKKSSVLSYPSHISKKIVSFFETGVLSRLFLSAKKVDSFIPNKVLKPLEKHIGFRKNVLDPTRRWVSGIIDNNHVSRAVTAVIPRFLSVSLRSFGVFFLTFALYAAGIYFLKIFANIRLGNSTADDLSASAIVLLVGIILTLFGDKSLISALANGRCAGYIMDSFGINEAYFRNREAAVPRTGTMFLAGTLLGISTLFFAPIAILKVVATVLLALTVFFIPEFGLLASVAVLPAVSADFLKTAVAYTAICYIIKCIRMKRNFYFGAVDICMVGVLAFSAIGVDAGTLMCFSMLYFLARNMLNTERLIRQANSTLCIALVVGMAFYLGGHFAHHIPFEYLRNTVVSFTDYSLGSSFMGLLTAILIPFVFSQYAAKKRLPAAVFTVVLTLASIVIADIAISCYLLVVSAAIYIAVGKKAPVGAALFTAVMIPAFSFLHSPVSAMLTHLGIIGGTGEELADSGIANGFLANGGIIPVILVGICLLLTVQKMFSSIITSEKKDIFALCGAVVASVVSIAVCCFVIGGFYADLRVIALLCFVIGYGNACFAVISGHSEVG